MRKAVIVIGCSYGDEGKGLAAAHAAAEMGKPCLNVLINGGAQRGHTVNLPDGRRHVFRHFGSGTLAGAESCMDEDFIVNPLLYMDERIELQETFGICPEVMASARCRVTLPWDMMLGQIIEENRGVNRHGSCGCGIFETRLRYEQTDWALSLGELGKASEDTFRAYCRRLSGEYIPARLKAMGMAADVQWQQLLADERIIVNAWADLQAMLKNLVLYDDWAAMAAKWPSLVFEAGQGLALDENNRQDFPHLTPSQTTSLVSARRIAALPGQTNTELRYVTRTYLTRHGAGPFPTECPMESINPDIIDLTNVPNPHQQTIRYGWFDDRAVLDRVERDRTAARCVLPEAVAAVMVTHLNETGGELAMNPRQPCRVTLTDFISCFDLAYLSDSPWEVRQQKI
ncbi:MAG: adenylosuccinate synthetase [Clostridia bacterium]|nr:adenylosuccinate synthetase [Clostridia bacterium]